MQAEIDTIEVNGVAYARVPCLATEPFVEPAPPSAALKERRIEFLATEDERARWAAKARTLGISLSEFFRRAINAAVARS